MFPFAGAFFGWDGRVQICPEEAFTDMNSTNHRHAPWVSHTVRRVIDAVCGCLRQSGIHTSAQELEESGYSFWVEGRQLWIYRHGREISFRDLIVEFVGESVKRDFIEAHTPHYEKEKYQ